MKGHRVLPLALLFLSACSSFQAGRPLDQLPLPVPPEKRIEVWSHGTRYQLHALTVDADSVHGVKWWQHPNCDSCRVSLARASVDSVRTLAYDGSETGITLLISLPFVLLVWLFTRAPD